MPSVQQELVKHWAAEQLGRPADAPSSELRQAFMKRLRGDDFLPPWRIQQAYQAAESGRLAAQTSQELENWLRPQVEEFAAGFFQLPPDERRQRWQQLLERCSFSSPLTARLRALEAGLDLPVDIPAGNPLGCGSAHELLEEVRGLFVLRPLERAARRQALVRAGHVRANLRELQVTDPDIMDLEPILVQQLKRPVRTVPTRTRVADTAGGDWLTLRTGAQIFGLLMAVALIGAFSKSKDRERQPPAPKRGYHEEWDRLRKIQLPPSRNLDPDPQELERVRKMLEQDPDGMGEATRRLLGLEPRPQSKPKRPDGTADPQRPTGGRRPPSPPTPGPPAPPKPPSPP